METFLNQEQEKAVAYTQGPLMVIAGAGTGKTTVLTEKVKYLINERLAKPSEILALTFTEKAAREMEERVDQALPMGYVQTWISTFHSFGEEILRQEALAIGLDPAFTLLTAAEAQLFVSKYLHEFELDYYRPLGSPYKFVSGLVAHFSRLKDEDVDPKGYMQWVNERKGETENGKRKTEKDETRNLLVVSRDSESSELPSTNNELRVANYGLDELKKFQELARAYDTYEKLKQKHGVMDFSDLIVNTLKLFREKPDILKRYQEKFKYILVDEYQDTNYAQTELARLLAQKHKRVAVFLDDDQSIYRFRGAAVYNAMDFRQHFPDSELVVLVKNYRTTQAILDHAYQLVSHNNPDRLEVQEKIDKKLLAVRGVGSDPIVIWCERGEDEAEQVVEEIKKLANVESGMQNEKMENGKWKMGKEINLNGDLRVTNYDFKDIAILVRANNHADIFTRALARHGIPFQFLGPGQLYNQSEIRDLLAYFRILNDFTDDQAMYRLLTKPYFGIDRRDIAALVSWARDHHCSLFEMVEQLMDQETAPLGIRLENIQKVKQLLKILTRHLGLVPHTGPGQLLYYFLEDTGMLALYQEPHTEQQQRELGNISKFFDELRAFELQQPEGHVRDWLEYVEHVWAVGESPIVSEIDWTQQNAVNILTVHSAKGLEFPVVFMVNLVNDRFPTRNRRDQIPIPDELAREAEPEGGAHEHEERRLFYVGMTRAKDRLYLTGAKFYGENKRPKKLSGFVHEALGENLSPFILGQGAEQVPLPLFDFASTPQESDEVPDRYAADGHEVRYLDYSRISAFQICPLHYKLAFLNHVPTKTSGALNLGTAVHNTLKQFYQWVLVQEDPVHVSLDEYEEKIAELFNQNWVRMGFASHFQEQAMHQQGEQWLREYVQKNFNPAILPIALEQKFWFQLGDLKIGGRIDRVDRLPDGSLEIIDYKTGTASDQKQLRSDLQLAIYGLAATHPDIYNQPVDKLKLSYHYFETGEKQTIDISPQRLEEAKQQILTVRDQIGKSDFACSHHFICQQGCEYDLFCQKK